ncbi:MarR family transcriptional regulator [Streptomyces lincolnensis]|uniref:MarR family transcriptional regulator n=1 Tax=Streptomyces lincolnensis TaxID=1915 RepID=A0A1B1MM00_STRLN|nr:helix-turn-helix domain-containing protein [Streptomyces lincolnensis]ANS69626.1 MarR family transcriptional regulator [Streptomyces lincolnensis]AXG58545.1 MarR family transcriptional regulator [Streptomyces lincolnensis]QMV11182.1 transcriptional regulator [Streptomyces lincolnensis]
MTHQTVGYAPAGDRDGPLADCPDSALVPPGHEPRCPVDITLAVLGGRWTPLVLREFLRRGEATYSELSAALPALSDKVLSDRLAQLTGAGVLERHRIPGWPPRVHYALTVQGRELEPVMRGMWEWGSARRGALGGAPGPSGTA